MKTLFFRRMQLVLLVYSVCHLSLVEGSKVMARTYTSNFPFTQNPIFDSGNWIDGFTTGVVWSDVQTTPGLAFGTQVGFEGTVGDDNDSTALLTGTWGPNQTASATVYTINQQSGSVYEEVSIRLRSSLSAHSCTGYEINFSLKSDPTQTYCQIVRWNGPLNDFEYLGGQSYGGPTFTLKTGDVVTATIINSTITAYINGVQIRQETDPIAYSSGSPGMGFYIQGASGVDGDYGFTSYTATDGIITMLASSQNPSLPGDPVTFTATVIGSAVTPTGTVQFKANGFAFGSAATLDDSGTAISDSVSTLPHGITAITAEYSGDANFLTSTGSISQVINTPPVGGTHYLTTVTGTPLNVNASILAGLDYDADNDTLTITAVSSPSTQGGIVTLSAPGGTITYSPGAYVGTNDQFTYTISDGFTGGTATSTAIVIVRLNNATSTFISPTMPSSGAVALRGYGIPGQQYDIQRSSDLLFTPVNTTTLTTVTADANGIILHTDNDVPSPSYYRFAVH
jgi:hypothetical protein